MEAFSQNPFDVINKRFDRLENLLLSQVKKSTDQERPQLRYLDIDEASQFTKLPKQTIYQACSKRKIKHTKVGRHLRFLESDLIEFIETNRRKTDKELTAQAAFDLSQKVKK